MPQTVIENPILNSPFEEPKRHFKFTEDGITDTIVASRRTSSYFVPISRPKKRSPKQIAFETEWTADRLEENKFINDVRGKVALWRKGGYIGITRTTAKLLEYWKNPERDHRLFFCQIEALETVIYITEVAGKYGDLTVLISRMNPDLSMGDALLKKTGAANLFMVFGEPDIDVKKQKDGRLVVTIRGLDVYDPTTGEIRSHKTDDIACWFIDTDYNGESFFVRHAYFTGAGDPYKRLKRALRAEIDETAWSALNSTKSLPFDPPSKGKIAVKVINHYGDEVMKVYEVG